VNLKQEVIQSIKREDSICNIAIDHLKKSCHDFEKKYHMSTGSFLKKFNKGKLGDEQDFFKWYSVSEGVKDWLKTRSALREILK